MQKENGAVSVWTIAGGILLALVIWRAMNIWQYNRAVEEANAMMAKTMQDIRKDSEAARQNFAEQQRQREQSTAIREHAAALREQRMRNAKELKPDERCINKQRFRRVTNGWEQVGSC